MKITAERVQRVAELARLALSDAEAQRLSAELSVLVEHFEALDQLDTAGVQPTSHAVPLVCPGRTDEVRASMDHEILLSAAPRRDGGYFLVPKIID